MAKKIAIIGGGIVGASAGYYLSKAGNEVTLFDEGTGQATSAAAGIICPWLSRRRNKKWFRLVSEGAVFYQQLVRDLSADGFSADFYHQTGAIITGKQADYVNEVYERAIEKRKTNPMIGTVKILDSKGIQALFPTLTTSKEALFVSGGSRVDGEILIKTLLRATKAFGGTIHQEKACLSTSYPQPVIQTANQRIPFDAVILAAGAWLPELLRPLGYSVDIRPQKGQLLVAQTQSTNGKDYPVVMPEGEIDILPFSNGKIVIGATHENGKGYNLDPDNDLIENMFDQAKTLIPELKNAVWKEIRVGTRAYTSDFSPFFGKVPALQNVYTAGGLGSTGLTCGPLIGFALSEAIEGKDPILSFADYPVENYVKTKEGFLLQNDTSMQ